MKKRTNNRSNIRTQKHITIERQLHLVGPAIRHTMKGAIRIIQKEAATFIAEAKEAYDPAKDDIVTSADRAAQEHYVKYFTKHFPTFGIIGEENALNKPCNIADEDIYFTIDPLDGTKAFARRQSTGVGTMVSVVRNGKVIAAYVGDVNTGEIYGFAPDIPIPTRTRFGVTETMAPNGNQPLAQRYVLANTAPSHSPLVLQKFVCRPAEGGLFKDLEVVGGSYGVFFARLWKGEVGALVLDPAHTTPWDESPIIGITQQLGFVRIIIDPTTLAYRIFEQTPPKEVGPMPWWIIAIHNDYLPQVNDWLSKNVSRAL